MRLVLVDDERARRWSPFIETRPASELRFGALLLRERVERWISRPADAILSAAHLTGFDEPGCPPVGTEGASAPAGSGEGTLFWSSRCAPHLDTRLPDLPGDRPLSLVMGGAVCGLWVPAGTPLPAGPHPSHALGDPASETGGGTAVEGTVLEWPWTLVEANATALARDLRTLYPGDVGAPPTPGETRGARGQDADSASATLPAGVHAVGGAGISMGTDVRLGPGVVLDVREGPIRLDDGVQVDGPARLVGPLHLGPGCQVFGGHLERVSAGPVCKLRGEIGTAVLLGYANKAHDGYLGHALLGRWVNLGALTTNSDLKNDYGPVRVTLPDPAGAPATLDTGLMKVGVFLADHVKTGIGTVLNTGAVVGAGSNVFGGGMPPGWIPPFSWVGAGRTEPYRWGKFVRVARTAMGRRDQDLTEGCEAVLRALWERTHGAGPAGAPEDRGPGGSGP